MADGAVFDHRLNLFTIAGVQLFLGRAPGTYFTFAYDTAQDEFSTVGGVDGTGYYNTTGDLRATMTLVVQPNSEDNSILMTALLTQRNTPGGVRWPIFVQQGLSIYTGFGLVAGQPPLEFADAAVTRPWKVISTKMLGAMGGAAAAPVLSTFP